MVCPTCFCTTVDDHSDLTGAHRERERKWDSCFTMDFSYIHGGSVRQSGSARYRQWMTHKLASWYDQFGTSGCVGCGRCITWCPIGYRHNGRSCRDQDSPAAGTEETEWRDLSAYSGASFFAGFPKEHRQLLAGCAQNHRFNAGHYLFHEGDPADEFFLIRHGKVALEIVAPGRAPIVFETVARRRDRRRILAGPALPLDVRRPRRRIDPRHRHRRRCLRGKCEADHHLGYEMMKRFLPILVDGFMRQASDPRRLSASAIDETLHPIRFLPQLYRVASATPEIAGYRDARNRAASPGNGPHFAAGQFNMLYAFGVGEVAISMSGDPRGWERLRAHGPRCRRGRARR